MILVTASLPTSSLYQRLATMFSIVALLAFIRWCREHTLARLVSWAVPVGMGVASKQTQGFVVAVALGVLMLTKLLLDRASPRKLVAVTSGLRSRFHGNLLVVLLPILLLGNYHSFYANAVEGAGAHARDAGQSYFATFGNLLTTPVGSLFLRAERAWQASYFLLLFAAAVALLMGIASGPRDDDRWVIAATLGTTIAAIVTLYPRADHQHAF